MRGNGNTAKTLSGPSVFSYTRRVICVICRRRRPLTTDDIFVYRRVKEVLHHTRSDYYLTTVSARSNTVSPTYARIRQAALWTNGYIPPCPAKPVRPNIPRVLGKTVFGIPPPPRRSCRSVYQWRKRFARVNTFRIRDNDTVRVYLVVRRHTPVVRYFRTTVHLLRPWSGQTAAAVFIIYRSLSRFNGAVP